MFNLTRYAAEGIVAVSINYRLGLFGFMNTFDEDRNMTVGGNYGLIDQQMAIKFIRQNCDQLGCDPDKITLFGESSGAQSVSWAMDSKKFFRIIVSRYIYIQWWAEK